MKKLFIVGIAALSLFVSLPAAAVDPVPMVDIEVTSGSLQVPREFAEHVVQAYGLALNDEVVKRGTLDILAVGARAKIVVTEYHDPNDISTHRRLENDRMALGGSLNPTSPRIHDAWSRAHSTGRPDRAKVAGYIEFDGQRIPFEQISTGSGPVTWLAADVGRSVLRHVLAM